MIFEGKPGQQQLSRFGDGEKSCSATGGISVGNGGVYWYCSGYSSTVKRYSLSEILHICFPMVRRHVIVRFCVTNRESTGVPIHHVDGPEGCGRLPHPA